MKTIIEWFGDTGVYRLIMFIVGVVAIVVAIVVPVLLWLLSRHRASKKEKAARKDARPSRPRKRYTTEDLTRRKRDSCS